MIAAVFDVDGTILPGTTAERIFFRYLWQRGEMGFRDLWRLGRSRLAHFHDTMAARLERTHFRGRSVSAMEDTARRCLDAAIVPRLSRIALRRIEIHRQQGHMVLLLTGSLDLLMYPLSERLGAAACLCSALERKENRYTGRIAPPHPWGAAKCEILGHYAKGHDINLATSVAYADSLSDLPILESVGFPVAVNPSRVLRKLARQRGWSVESWK